MTNSRTIAGAVAWALISMTLSFAALQPVEAAGACPAGSRTVGQACTTLAIGETAADCKPLLA